jgi:hypothetical protein
VRPVAHDAALPWWPGAISRESADLEAFYDDVAACYRAELEQLGNGLRTFSSTIPTWLICATPRCARGAPARDDPVELARLTPD